MLLLLTIRQLFKFRRIKFSGNRKHQKITVEINELERDKGKIKSLSKRFIFCFQPKKQSKRKERKKF